MSIIRMLISVVTSVALLWIIAFSRIDVAAIKTDLFVNGAKISTKILAFMLD